MTQRRRDIAIQLLALVLIAAPLLFLASNLRANLDRMGIGVGLGFLSNPAGFDLSFSITSFGAASSYGYAFWTAFLNTVLVSALGIVGATMIGTIMGVARWTKLPIVSDIGTVYVEVFRNIPLLLQIFFLYFGVIRSLPAARDTLDFAGAIFLNNRGLYLPRAPIDGVDAYILAILVALSLAAIAFSRRAKRYRVYTGTHPSWRYWPRIVAVATLCFAVSWAIFLDWETPNRTRFGLSGGLEVVPELVALAVALSIYFGSYVAETVRAGLNGVAKGQWEAASALGLTPLRTLQLVLMPQAMRIIIPPMANIYLTLVKASALGAAIAYPELIQIANTTLNQTGQAIGVSGILVIAYVSLNLAIVGVVTLIERRYRRGMRRG